MKQEDYSKYNCILRIRMIAYLFANKFRGTLAISCIGGSKFTKSGKRIGISGMYLSNDDYLYIITR